MVVRPEPAGRTTAATAVTRWAAGAGGQRRPGLSPVYRGPVVTPAARRNSSMAARMSLESAGAGSLRKPG